MKLFITLIVKDVHEIWSVHIKNYLEFFAFTSYVGFFLKAPIQIKRNKNLPISNPQQTPIYAERQAGPKSSNMIKRSYFVGCDLLNSIQGTKTDVNSQGAS